MWSARQNLLDKSAAWQQDFRAMSMLLDKIIPLFVYPAGFIVLCGLVCLLFLAWGWRRMAVVWLSAGLLYAGLTSMPAVARLLAVSLERQYPVVTADRLPGSDAIILLGGVVADPTNLNPYFDVSETADRVLHAARLYKAGLAPRVIVSGGRVFPDPDLPSEAEYLRQLLVELGVDAEAIVLETQSRNTYENGLLSAKLMQERELSTALLVTSAWHMPRAAAVFRKAGVKFTPAPTDTLTSSLSGGIPFGYLPNVKAMYMSTLCIKEWIGFAVYRLRGWL